eukprot:TRINITY_DN29245_c0_g1_i3.p1 TRINITY_DN29245_c0_g1~~TRINITY_DN29245_c0_g1_i3.p1  ORF type:complete len:213 (+),score=7.68 TRINITY_DN29245_c0_g1_i3:324-962(+)
MTAVELLDEGCTVLISVGCGGPIVRQKYPPAVQAAYAAGHPVCLVMIDPCLFCREHTTSSSATYVEKSGDRYTLLFEEIALVEEDLPLFQAAFGTLRARHCKVLLKDHRGAAFGGITYPLENILPSDHPELHLTTATLERDSIVDDIFAVTLGDRVQVEEEMLNVVSTVGEAINATELLLRTKPATSIERRIVSLDGGSARAKRMRFYPHTF